MGLVITHSQGKWAGDAVRRVALGTICRVLLVFTWSTHS